MGHWWMGQGPPGKGHGWWAKVHNDFFLIGFQWYDWSSAFSGPRAKEKTHLWGIRLRNIWKIGKVQFHRTWQDVACMLVFLWSHLQLSLKGCGDWDWRKAKVTPIFRRARGRICRTVSLTSVPQKGMQKTLLETFPNIWRQKGDWDIHHGFAKEK